MFSSSKLKSPKSSNNASSSHMGENCYPLPAYLNFTPGGIICTHDEDPTAHKYSLNKTDPSFLIQRALDADTQLNQYAQESARQHQQYGTETPDLPFRAPSLSALADAAFGPLTGIAASRTRAWADTMVLSYYQSHSNSPQKRKKGDDVPSLLAALKQAAQQNKLGVGSKRLNRPCGYIFRRGDIAWNCRTCQTDTTCVLCDTCFRNSDHTGHDVLFHRTSPGGCCDCGDIEAWKADGCCPVHRPFIPEETMEQMQGGKEEAFDEFEAVTSSLRGRKDGESMLRDDELLTPGLKAALGVVIGAAIQSIVKAVDGAGISADAAQWRIRWAEQISRISGGNMHEEDLPKAAEPGSPDLSSIQNVLKTDKHFPSGFKLQLRLHNDDVHTFDEVIVALHEQVNSNNEDEEAENIDDIMLGLDTNGDANPSNGPTGQLVPQRAEAEQMTHHVDSDGQVNVRSYSSFKEAMVGFKRLKSNGLHCAVVSSPQDDLERRVKVLTGWLKDVASAHPAAAALVAHALLDVTAGQDTFGGVSVCTDPRMIPCWSGTAHENEDVAKSFRLKAFPPHLPSSYLTREEGRELFKVMKTHMKAQYLYHLTGTNPHFYDSARLLDLPSDRMKKSPHALWGTLDVPPSNDKPPHPILADTIETPFSVTLCPNIYLIDTDLRKQQETDKITTSLFPHKLAGLHLISGVGILNYNRPDLLRLLDATSFRAPYSALLLILLLDPYPPKQVRGTIHQLFLSLLVDSRFRSRFAAAFGGVAYRPLSTLFCAGCGTEADTPLGFTVQVFTTGSLVRALGNVEATQKLLEYDGSDASLIEASSSHISTFTIPLPLTVVRAVHTNLLGATKEVKMVVKNTTTNAAIPSNLTYQQGEHPLITPLPAAPDDGFLDSRTTKHKRIPHLLRDLEYIFETPGTALRLLLPEHYTISKLPSTHFPLNGNVIEFVQAWARLLRIAQGMDSQKRRISGGHVEFENVRWYEAFGLSINFAGMRDALAESPVSIPCKDEEEFRMMHTAVGNLLTAVLQEIKLWLYQEQLLNTGLPSLPMVNSSETNQLEVLQRSTLHVSSSHLAQANMATLKNFAPVALTCATGVKMTEAQLSLIELALQSDEQGQRASNTTPRAIMGDWLRVPHSPLMGHFLSFHLPLHRALAKTIKSLFSVPISIEMRERDPRGWWKIPVLDAEETSVSNNSTAEHFEASHTLKDLLAPTIGVKNCLVTWNDGPDCSPAEAHSRRTRKHVVSSAIAAAKVIHSLCDHPLRCLAAAQQIDRHLWARNGNSATGMALNYGSSPLCNSFRDLDLTLVQLSISGFSVGLGARRSFGLLMSRFNMDGYLCDPVKRISTSSTAGGNNGGWVNPPRMQDPDHAVAMSEAFFSTLCMLVTELPPPPPTSKEDDSIMKISMRRELLHALAAEPKSYSEALSAASFGTSLREENDTLRSVFSDVLRSIALEKRAQAQVSRAAPPTFELKAECSDEYDPSFFHLRRIDHQHAMDRVARLRKQKCGNNSNKGKMCLPLVAPPPKAHLRFLPCRLILHLSMTDAAIRRALLFALTGGNWLPPSKPTPPDMEVSPIPLSSSDDNISPLNSIRSSSRIRRGFPRSMTIMKKNTSTAPPFSPAVVAASSVSFLEVLQVLTLQGHTLEECSSLHHSQNLDEESRQLSAGISIKSYLTRLIFMPDSLEDCWALGCPEPLSSAGSGEKRGSILGLLIALYEHRNEHGAASGNGNNDDGGGGARALVSEGLKWLLRFVSLLVDGTMSISDARENATKGIRPANKLSEDIDSNVTSVVYPSVTDSISRMMNNLPDLWPEVKDVSSSSTSSLNKKSLEARKAAQRRAMEKMKMRQASFAASLANSEGESKKMDDSFHSFDDEEDLCIICKCDDTDGDNNGPLGFLGHVQRSRVLQLRGMTELSNGDDLHCMARVVGDKGCQLRAGEEMNSAPIACLPRGSLVKILQSKISSNYDLLSRRVLVRFTALPSGPGEPPAITEGWASVESSQGYVILALLKELSYNNTRWGSTRPIIRQCGHAAHLGCVETHCLSLHQRSAADQPFDGRFAANLDEGEFLCPLCKQLSNVLVPKGFNGSKESNKQDVDEELLNLSTIDSSGVEGTQKLKKLLINGMKNSVSEEIRSADSSSILAKKFKGEREAIRRFGDNLLLAMQTPWHIKLEQRQKRQWSSSLTKWDYEDDPTEEMNPDGPAPNYVGDILRLLRQQHVAWASIGYCAASAEASSRGSQHSTSGEQSMFPTQQMSSIYDPWAGYDTASRDTYPMLLELRRTLSATSSLLGMLNYDIEKKLGHDKSTSSKGVTNIGELLGNVLDGGNFSSNELSDEWRALLPYISSQPCHVARDGVFSPKNEARATAASMWAINGLGTSSSSMQKQDSEGETKSILPPAPLAVNKSCVSSTEGTPNLKDGWGSNNPFSSSSDSDNYKSVIPFRPAVASTFLYIPLLAWDMNTLSSAILSSLLLNKAQNFRYEDLLLTARTLLVGRLIQILITPNGFYEKGNHNTGSTNKRSRKEEQSESRSLSQLQSYCKSFIEGSDFTSTIVNKFSKDEDDRLMDNVSHALLPFSRSLTLLLRACCSMLRHKQRVRSSSNVTSMNKPSPAEVTFISLLEESEAMCVNDGFYVLRAIGGPMPSELILHSKERCSSSNWTKLIDRWLGAVVSLESFHGSRGKGVSYDTKNGKWVPSYVTNSERNSSTVNSVILEDKEGQNGVEVQSVLHQKFNEVSSPNVFNKNTMDSGRRSFSTHSNDMDVENDFDFVHHMETDDGSEDEEMEDVDDGNFVVQQEGAEDDESINSHNGAYYFVSDPSNGNDGSDNELSQYSKEETSNDDIKFAQVSTSPIIPYQPSILRKQEVGPGPRGIDFDFVGASKIMHDLSHFGMIHCPDAPNSGLIRLPHSFVELYSIVNKVKRRDLINVDESDDSSTSEIAICLLTGAIMRSGSARRSLIRSHARPVGPCTLHARKVGSGVGIFFLVQKCTVLLMHNNKSAYSASLYVDDHGEEDPGLRRGRPLFLKPARYQALETLWRQHGIPREVSQIRSTSDRVIRDNWY